MSFFPESIAKDGNKAWVSFSGPPSPMDPVGKERVPEQGENQGLVLLPVPEG